MYIFVLVLFLSVQPETLVRFLGNFDDKKACDTALVELQEKYPNQKGQFSCLQVVNPNKVKDI